MIENTKILTIETKGRRKGFSLIELLIVVAIIGIIAAVLIPNLLDALHKSKQKRTVGDIRNTGNAWLQMLTDQYGAMSSGAQKSYRISDMGQLNYSGLHNILHPTDTFFYMQEVPQLDGWRECPYIQGINVGLVGGIGLEIPRFIIASMGRDCSVDSDNEGATGDLPFKSLLRINAFLATDYDHDIIWADGYFVQWPEGTKR